MNAAIEQQIRQKKCAWLVTGGAGFIGSHLVERLLEWGQDVVVLDNLSTGYEENLDDVRHKLGAKSSALTFIKGDVAESSDCVNAMRGIDFVLHQAALGSVPRSIENPLATHRSNVDGFINMLEAARRAKVKRFVYASSSSVYGDDATLPKLESKTGQVLSPYAATKHINEVYASVFQRTYKIETIGLRYFNVFGPRQDPNGAYAAVIPKWIHALSQMQECRINGDGSTSRDFCFVENAVQANLRAAVAHPDATHRVYNIALGDKTSLNSLYEMICDRVAKKVPALKGKKPNYGPFREGDIKDSQATISSAIEKLGYAPTHKVSVGLDVTVDWFLSQSARS